MLLIIQIAMLVGGIYSMVSAKVPSFLVGGDKYQVEGRAARLFGVLLMLPLPIAFLGGVVLGLLFGEDGAGYAMTLEIIIVVAVAILSVVLVRVMGKKSEPVNDVEATIAKKTQGALMYAVFSVTGFAALICCPLAIIYANQAENLIDEFGVGQQYRRRAKNSRTVAGIATLLWVFVVVCLASFMFAGTQ
jgi:hypothetical protein